MKNTCIFKDHSGYEGRSFEQAVCDEERIESVTFFNCRFVDSSFQFARLADCEFEDCTFVNCSLSLAAVNGSRFSNAQFEGCKLLGINWSESGVVFTASFVNCIMDNCVFADMNLKKFSFVSCSMVEAAFTNTQLAQATFEDCDLDKCRFHQANLTRTDFTTARNYFINHETNILKKTRFSLPEAALLLKNFDIVLE